MISLCYKYQFGTVLISIQFVLIKYTLIHTQKWLTTTKYRSSVLYLRKHLETFGPG